MFIFNDDFFKTEIDGKERYFTKEYLEHNGDFNGTTWKIGSTEYEMTKDNEIKYQFDSGKEIKCNYSQLFRDDDSLIMCNEISRWGNDDGMALTLESGTDYDEENDCYCDIYQFFIINNWLADWLSKHTDEIVYFHDGLEIYVLGVTHWGTSWDYVGATFTL